MVSEATWGFSYEDVPVGGFDNPPPGHYTMEIADTIPKLNSKGGRYLSVVYNILDSDNAEWVGKTYRQYVSFDPERLRFAKADFARMGVPPESQKNDGGPTMMIGTVFECDMVESIVNENTYVNMRQIKPFTKLDQAKPPSQADAQAAAAPVGGTSQPRPRRAGTTGQR